jgi:hypothetical protein
MHGERLRGVVRVDGLQVTIRVTVVTTTWATKALKSGNVGELVFNVCFFRSSESLRGSLPFKLVRGELRTFAGVEELVRGISPLSNQQNKPPRSGTAKRPASGVS